MVVFIVWLVFICLEQKTNVNLKKSIGKKIFYDAEMPSKDPKILDFNQYWKSDKTPSTIYEDLWSLINEVDGFKENPVKLPTTIVREHIIRGYTMSKIWTFDIIDNKHEVFRVEECMKTFSESLTEQSMKIINFDTINKGRVRFIS